MTAIDAHVKAHPVTSVLAIMPAVMAVIIVVTALL